MEKTDIAKTFQIGLEYLWDGRTPSTKPQHFCNALLRAHKEGRFSYSQYIAATEFIQKRLGKYYTVIAWLQARKGFHNIQKRGTDEQFQEYRKAWVLSMIKELSK